MKKSLLICLLLISISVKSQDSKLIDFGKRMYFYLFSDSAHIVVYDFAKTYSSILVENPDTSGVWAAYFDDHIKNDTFTYSKHSLIIPKHPYFEAEYLYSTFELTIKQSKNYSPSVYDLNLFFTFDSRQKAISAFRQIVSTLSSYSAKGSTSKKKDGWRANFYSATDSSLYNQMQFAIVNDPFNKKLYHLYFSRGIAMYNTDRAIYLFKINIPD